MKKGRIIAIAGSVLVIGGVFVFILPRIADYSAVWDTLQGLTWEQGLALLAAEIINLATFAPPYMASLPGLGYWRGEVISQASTASTYVAPGGAAVGIGIAAAMLIGWGFSGSAVALAVTLTGVWNQLFMLAAPAVALGLLTYAGEGNTTLQIVAIIGFAVFLVAIAALVVAFWSHHLAQRLGDLAARFTNWCLRLIRRKPVKWSGESLARFRLQTIGLLRR